MILEIIDIPFKSGVIRPTMNDDKAKQRLQMISKWKGGNRRNSSSRERPKTPEVHTAPPKKSARRSLSANARECLGSISNEPTAFAEKQQPLLLDNK